MNDWGSRDDDPDFHKWARQVKINNSFTCEICDSKGGYLEAHHLNSWDIHPNERYDLDNSACLCGFCHRRFHETYGYGKNTKYQYAEYKEVADVLKSIINKVL